MPRTISFGGHEYRLADGLDRRRFLRATERAAIRFSRRIGADRRCKVFDDAAGRFDLRDLLAVQEGLDELRAEDAALEQTPAGRLQLVGRFFDETRSAAGPFPCLAPGFTLWLLCGRPAGRLNRLRRRLARLPHAEAEAAVGRIARAAREFLRGEG